MGRCAPNVMGASCSLISQKTMNHPPANSLLVSPCALRARTRRRGASQFLKIHSTSREGTPTGFCPPAQGCPSPRGLPWVSLNKIINPNGVVSFVSARSTRHNPVGIGTYFHRYPKVGSFVANLGLEDATPLALNLRQRPFSKCEMRPRRRGRPLLPSYFLLLPFFP